MSEGDGRSLQGRATYGHEMTDTRTIPSMMADFIRKAIRKAVNKPPATIPSHIYC